jgi:COP9 signalosome complex subunit 12
VGLSKNVLRALDASSGDLPELDAFPKSHIVAFKYYVGVICFLEENYTEVGNIVSILRTHTNDLA